VSLQIQHAQGGEWMMGSNLLWHSVKTISLIC